MYVWLVMYVMLFVLMLMCENKMFALKVCALSLTMIFLAGYTTSGVLSMNLCKLNVFYAGDGTAVMYSDKDVNAVLELDCKSNFDYLTVDKIGKTTNKVDFCSSVSDTMMSVRSLYSLTKAFAISDVLLYDTRRSVELDKTVDNTIIPTENYTVELSDNASVSYILTDDGYIIYLNTNGDTALILPPSIDAKNIEPAYRKADYIVMNNSPLNSGLLSCDTLIISNFADVSKKIMKFTDVTYERVLLASDSDIEIILEV